MRRALFVLAGASALGVMGLLLAGFMWPDVKREVNLGAVEAFAPGTVTSYYIPPADGSLRQLEPGEIVESGCPNFATGEWRGLAGTVIHLVRLGDGELRALSGRSTHIGEMVVWDAEGTYDGVRGHFIEPCHSERWLLDGTRLFGPAPRGLDRFDLRIEDGRVIVDPTKVTRGSR